MNSENNLEEEIFCLQYELKTLSEIFFYNKAERWVKGFMHKNAETEHLKRYDFACGHVKGKRVLDIACGCGYGSSLLLKQGQAQEIIGVDIEQDAIRYANHRYYADNIKRYVGDGTKFSDAKKFDVIISFETIEHVPNYKELLENFYNNLNESGILLISTPINKITTTNLNNPYHVIEWSFSDFHKLLENYFEIQEVYLQNVKEDLGYKEKKISLHKELIFKIRPDLKEKHQKELQKKKVQIGKDFEIYQNQYKKDRIYDGYQLVLAKRKSE